MMLFWMLFGGVVSKVGVFPLPVDMKLLFWEGLVTKAVEAHINGFGVCFLYLNVHYLFLCKTTLFSRHVTLVAYMSSTTLSRDKNFALGNCVVDLTFNGHNEVNVNDVISNTKSSNFAT